MRLCIGHLCVCVCVWLQAGGCAGKRSAGVDHAHGKHVQHVYVGAYTQGTHGAFHGGHMPFMAWLLGHGLG